MKVVRQISWELPPLEHFQNNWDCDVESMEDVKEVLDYLSVDELCEHFGWYPTEETIIKE